MRLEPPPRILLQKFLTNPQLDGTGVIHPFFPGGPIVGLPGPSAPIPVIAFHAGMPDTRRAAGVARRAAQEVHPKNMPLGITKPLLHMPLIACFPA